MTRPYQGFGELALFGDGLRTLDARAKTAVRLVRVIKPQLFAMLDADPTIALALLKELSLRVIRLRREQYGPVVA